MKYVAGRTWTRALSDFTVKPCTSRTAHSCSWIQLRGDCYNTNYKPASALCVANVAVTMWRRIYDFARKGPSFLSFPLLSSPVLFLTLYVAPPWFIFVLPFTCSSFYPFPFPATKLPPRIQLGGLDSVVNSPSRVRGGSLSTAAFLCYFVPRNCVCTPAAFKYVFGETEML